MPSGREHFDPLTFRSERCTAHKDVHTHTIVPVSPKGSGPVPSHVQAKDRLSIWRTGWWRVSLLVLFLSVSNDVHQVLVVQVPCYIWGEGSEHLLHLTNRKTDLRSLPFTQPAAQCAFKRVMMSHNEMFLLGMYTGRHDDDGPVCAFWTHPHAHTTWCDIRMVISAKWLKCTSSGENRSACVVNICVTLSRREK